MCRLAWPGLGSRRQPRGAHAVLTPAVPTVKSRPGLSLHHQIGRCVGRSPRAPPSLTSLLGINCAVWDCSGPARPHRQHSPQVPLSEASAGGWLFHSFLSSKCHVLEASLGSTRRKVAPGIPARSPVLVLMRGSVPPTRPQVPQEPRPHLSLFRARPALSGAPRVFGG